MSDFCNQCGGLVPEPNKAYGYAGKYCYCVSTMGRLFPTQPITNPCNCIGPQNGQPRCPCQMRNVQIKNGRYVIPEQDLGPAKDTTP